MAAANETAPPECLTVWRCIGCGAMGNARECLGTCHFKRYFVVDAASHADLLEFQLNLCERNEALRRFARDVATEAATPERFEQALAGLRARAKSLLAQAPSEEAPKAVSPDERAEIWLCASCGMVEAPRDCLGICIRRNGDFIRGEDHDALNARIESARIESRSLASLARQVGWTTPRPGLSERTRAAVRTAALALLAGA